jgi:hypothetical protein
MGTVGVPRGSDDNLETVVYFIRREYDTPEHPARIARVR